MGTSDPFSKFADVVSNSTTKFMGNNFIKNEEYSKDPINIQVPNTRVRRTMENYVIQSNLNLKAIEIVKRAINCVKSNHC